MFSSDCETPGTFQPNMSDDDRSAWKAKLVGKKSGCLQVEIRKDSFVHIVALDGYNYKMYKKGDKWSDTNGLNMHIGASGPIQMTFKDWIDWTQAITEAIEVLIAHLEYKELEPGKWENTTNGFYDIYITEENESTKAYQTGNGWVILDMFDKSVSDHDKAHIYSERHVNMEAAKKDVRVRLLWAMKAGKAV
jgi:hypothetical protein